MANNIYYALNHNKQQTSTRVAHKSNNRIVFIRHTITMNIYQGQNVRTDYDG